MAFNHYVSCPAIATPAQPCQCGAEKSNEVVVKAKAKLMALKAERSSVRVSYGFRFRAVDESENPPEWSSAEQMTVQFKDNDEVCFVGAKNSEFPFPFQGVEYRDFKFTVAREHLLPFRERGAQPGSEEPSSKLGLRLENDDKTPLPDKGELNAAEFKSLLPYLLGSEADRVMIKVYLSNFFEIKPSVNDRRASALDQLLSWACSVDIDSSKLQSMLRHGEELHHALRVAALAFTSRTSELAVNNAVNTNESDDPLDKVAMALSKNNKQKNGRGVGGAGRAPPGSHRTKTCRYCGTDVPTSLRWERHDCPNYCQKCKKEVASKASHKC